MFAARGELKILGIAVDGITLSTVQVLRPWVPWALIPSLDQRLIRSRLFGV
jgi:hypothetical protein